jgi:Bacterial Ig-like domain (group 3)/FG-GAP-like repeat/Fibronectin type III domain
METFMLSLITDLAKYPTYRVFAGRGRWLILGIFSVLLGTFNFAQAQTSIATTTTLAVSSQTVSAGTPNTFTATVQANGTAVTPGQVMFCNSASAHCVDTAILGTAQLDSNGTASLTHLFNGGSNGVYAIFNGTATYAPSKSAAETITTSNKLLPVTTTLSTSGSTGNYRLTGTVIGQGKAALTGSVSFIAAANGNQSLGSAPLGTSVLQHGFSPQTLNPVLEVPSFHGDLVSDSSTIQVADVNGDGVPDLITTSVYFETNSQFQIQLGDPAHPGQFGSPTVYQIPGEQVYGKVVVGDFNHDGNLDLACVIAKNYFVASNEPGFVYVLLGDPSNHGRFLAGGTFATGPKSRELVAADFNHDGILDLAVTNILVCESTCTDPTISMLFGDPANPGSFLPAVTYPVANQGLMVTADFNEDGLPDLAMVSFTNQFVMDLLLNDQAHAGQFLPAASYPISSLATNLVPNDLEVGDLNGDGLPDLALADPNNVVLFFNNPGDVGTFSPENDFPQNGNVTSLAVGDYDGDGVLDLAFASDDGTNIDVLYGDPSHPGSLLPVTSYPSSAKPLTVLNAADLNGDGISDLLGVIFAFPTRSIETAIASYTQTATASITVPDAPGNYVEAVYSGDNNYASYGSCVLGVSAPGTTNIVVSGLTVTNITPTSVTVTWTTNISTNGVVDYGLISTFTNTTPWETIPSTTHSVTLPNLTPASNYAYQTRSVAFSNGCTHSTATSPTASFMTALPAHADTQTNLKVSATTTNDATPVTLTASVLSGNQSVTQGKVKFCDSTANICEGSAVLGEAVLLNDGSATLRKVLDPGSHSISALYTGTLAYNSSTSSPQTVSVQGQLLPSTTTITKSGSGPQYSLTASVSVTGSTPPTGNVSFVADASGVSLATTAFNGSTSTPGFSAPIVSPTPNQASPVLVGDVNNDGAPDVIASTTSGIQVYLGTPANPGKFQNLATLVTTAGNLALVDLNHDGFLDIISTFNSLVVLYNDPTHPGQFSPGQTYQLPLGSFNSYTGDFNGDGLLDIAVATNGSTFAGITVFLNDPTHPGQLLAGATLGDVVNSSAPIVVADFNRDGLSDIAFPNDATGVIGISFSDPAHPGQFLPVTNLPVNVDPIDLYTADFNHDGYPDLLTIDEFASNGMLLQLLLADPAHPGQFLTQPSIPTTFVPFYRNDMNGDGLPDLIGINYDSVSNATTVSIMYGDSAHKGQFLPTVTTTVPGNLLGKPLANLSSDQLPDFITSDNRGFMTILNQNHISSTTSPVTAQVQGNDAYVHAQYSGDELYFGSGSCSIDLSTTNQSPSTISAQTVSKVTSTSATVQWTTNVPTIGYVQYGTTSTFGQQTPWVNQNTTTHSFVLNGLTPGTTYSYRAASVSFFSGCNHSTTFSTPATFSTTAQ